LTRDPGDESKPPVTAVRIADPNRTHQQVKTLLAIVEGSEKILANVMEVGETTDFDKEAVASARSTHTLAHLQLRNILDDQNRWILNSSDGDQYLERLAEAQGQVTEDQKQNLALLRRPHRRYNAQLQFFPQVGWIAWVGGNLPTDTCLHGIGLSPEAAFQSFDMAFLRKAERQEPSPPEIPESPIAKKPKKRK
jgi:hypothetical protein